MDYSEVMLPRGEGWGIGESLQIFGREDIPTARILRSRLAFATSRNSEEEEKSLSPSGMLRSRSAH